MMVPGTGKGKGDSLKCRTGTSNWLCKESNQSPKGTKTHFLPINAGNPASWRLFPTELIMTLDKRICIYKCINFYAFLFVLVSFAQCTGSSF